MNSKNVVSFENTKRHNYSNIRSYTVGSNALKVVEAECADRKSKLYSVPEVTKSKSHSAIKIFCAVLLPLSVICGFALGAFQSAESEVNVIEYSVQPGDTLWELAKDADNSNNVDYTVSQIKQINGIGSRALQPGETIYIPVD